MPSITKLDFLRLGADDTYKVSSLQLPRAMIIWEVEIKSWGKQWVKQSSVILIRMNMIIISRGQAQVRGTSPALHSSTEAD